MRDGGRVRARGEMPKKDTRLDSSTTSALHSFVGDVIFSINPKIVIKSAIPAALSI